MIEFQNCCFAYDGKKVIENFTEFISSGEHVALMGESGAGKSTLMNSLMGLTVPSSGTIFVDGIELSHHHIHQIRSRIAWVPQEVHLPYATVRETVQAPFQLKVNQSMRFDQDRLSVLLQELGLNPDICQRRMQELSGGERQRLMIALALLLNKKILLLDEPTSAVDPQTRQKMISFLNSQEVTLLSVTHDLQFAQSCHRIINISKLKETL